MKWCGLVALCMVGSSLLIGCTSTRFTSTMQKAEVSGVQSNVYFKIVKAVPPKSGGTPTGFLLKIDELPVFGAIPHVSENEFCERLSRVAIERYPELFRDDSGAIPLEVSVTGKYSDSFGQSLLLEIGTLGIFCGILPLPMSETVDFKVAADMPDTLTHGVTYRQKEPVSFTRKDVSWMTFPFPLGLIPISGDSVAEKTSEIGQGEAIKTGGKVSLEGIVDALAISLEKMDIHRIQDVPVVAQDASPAQADVNVVAQNDPIKEKFSRLKALRDDGTLSESEYQTARERLVNQL